MWPQNYYDAIVEAIKQYDVVLVQLKPEHFDYFDKHNIKYSIAYPNINNWEEVERRCITRGNNENFIRRLKQVFIPYYEDSIKRNYDKLYILNGNETLEDILKKDGISKPKDLRVQFCGIGDLKYKGKEIIGASISSLCSMYSGNGKIYLEVK